MTSHVLTIELVEERPRLGRPAPPVDRCGVLMHLYKSSSSVTFSNPFPSTKIGSHGCYMDRF